MHAYRQLVEREMTAKGFTGRGGQTRLAEAAGISRQVVSTVVNDGRDRLIQVPEEKTVEGLAKAFHLKPETIWGAIAVSLGLPSYVVPSITHEVRTASHEDLLRELSARLGLAATFRTEVPTPEQTQKTRRAGVVPEDDAVDYDAPPKAPAKRPGGRAAKP